MLGVCRVVEVSVWGRSAFNALISEALDMNRILIFFTNLPG